MICCLAWKVHITLTCFWNIYWLMLAFCTCIKVNSIFILYQFSIYNNIQWQLLQCGKEEWTALWKGRWNIYWKLSRGGGRLCSILQVQKQPVVSYIGNDISQDGVNRTGWGGEGTGQKPGWGGCGLRLERGQQWFCQYHIPPSRPQSASQVHPDWHQKDCWHWSIQAAQTYLW